MKNVTLKLTLLTLIAGAAFVPQHADAMNWKKWLILGAVGAGLIYDIIEYNQTEEQLNKKLLSAAESGDIETVKNCLYHGAHLNTQDKHGYTPLMLACYLGHTDMVQYLVKNGADLNTKDKYGWTTLMRACERGHTDIVQYLIKNGAPLNTQDNDGWTPLMWACMNGYTNIVQCLVENGAHLNTQNTNGFTPLMWACMNGYTNIVQYLVENGAPLNTQNNYNQIAYDIAVQRGRQSTAQYLLNVQNELNKFKINPLKITTIAPKSTFIKMLYNECIYYIDTSKYTDLCSIFAMFKNNHNELKIILDGCKFLQCSKEEIKKLKKSGFPLTSGQLDMQLKLLQIQSNKKLIDLIIE